MPGSIPRPRLHARWRSVLPVAISCRTPGVAARPAVTTVTPPARAPSEDNALVETLLQGHSTATRQDGHRRGSTSKLRRLVFAHSCSSGRDIPSQARALWEQALRKNHASVPGSSSPRTGKPSFPRKRESTGPSFPRRRESTGPSFPRKRESTGEATLSQVLDPRSSRAPPSVSRAWVPCPYPVTGLGTTATLSPVTSRHFIRSASHVLPIANQRRPPYPDNPCSTAEARECAS